MSLKNFLKILTSRRDIIYLLSIFLCVFLLVRQCNTSSSLNREINRLENNICAVTDTLVKYKDENGRYIAEKHAYQFTEKELRDSVDLLKRKNREYLTYINTNMGIRDTIYIPSYIERVDSTKYQDEGVIKFERFDSYGKSFRNISVSIPYIYDDKLFTGNANIDVTQNIFVEGILEMDTRTNETFVRLMSDYPVDFNSGMGVVVTNSKTYINSIQKKNSIGIGIGPSFGVSYDIMSGRVSPTLGIGVTIGYTYTPSWTRW